MTEQIAPCPNLEPAPSEPSGLPDVPAMFPSGFSTSFFALDLDLRDKSDEELQEIGLRFVGGAARWSSWTWRT